MFKVVRMTAEEAHQKCNHIAMVYKHIDAFDFVDLRGEITKIAYKNIGEENYDIVLFLIRDDIDKIFLNPDFCNYNLEPSTKQDAETCGYLGYLDFTENSGSRACHLYISRYPHSTLKYYAEKDYDPPSIIEGYDHEFHQKVSHAIHEAAVKYQRGY